MSFVRNDRVVIKKMSKQGIVLDLLRDGRYKVAVGSLTLTCTGDDLRHLSEDENKRRERFPERPGWEFQGEIPTAHALARPLDLHGCTAAEAKKLVEQRVDQAARAGIDRIQILHGIGSGAVQKAVHELLAALPGVAHFKLAQANPGITWAYLK
ncbi:MAG: Smr/MutS family protein [Bdellovibrionota bacterium]|nr:MAG: Smr/MutS family protein [Bdellovibrionota bacterium]